LYRTGSITQAVRDVSASDWLLVRMLQSGVGNRVGGTLSVNTVVAALMRILYVEESELGIHGGDKLPLGIRLSLSDSVFDLVAETQDFND
jgi:hypothetical protein